MPWDRKRLLGYVETIQLILGVTDKYIFQATMLKYQKPLKGSFANSDDPSEMPHMVAFH